MNSGFLRAIAAHLAGAGRFNIYQNYDSEEEEDDDDYYGYGGYGRGGYGGRGYYDDGYDSQEEENTCTCGFCSTCVYINRIHASGIHSAYKAKQQLSTGPRLSDLEASETRQVAVRPREVRLDRKRVGRLVRQAAARMQAKAVDQPPVNLNTHQRIGVFLNWLRRRTVARLQRAKLRLLQCPQADLRRALLRAALIEGLMSPRAPRRFLPVPVRQIRIPLPTVGGKLAEADDKPKPAASAAAAAAGEEQDHIRVLLMLFPDTVRLVVLVEAPEVFEAAKFTSSQIITRELSMGSEMSPLTLCLVRSWSQLETSADAQSAVLKALCAQADHQTSGSLYLLFPDTQTLQPLVATGVLPGAQDLALAEAIAAPTWLPPASNRAAVVLDSGFELIEPMALSTSQLPGPSGEPVPGASAAARSSASAAAAASSASSASAKKGQTKRTAAVAAAAAAAEEEKKAEEEAARAPFAQQKLEALARRAHEWVFPSLASKLQAMKGPQPELREPEVQAAGRQLLQSLRNLFQVLTGASRMVAHGTNLGVLMNQPGLQQAARVTDQLLVDLKTVQMVDTPQACSDGLLLALMYATVLPANIRDLDSANRRRALLDSLGWGPGFKSTDQLLVYNQRLTRGQYRGLLESLPTLSERLQTKGCLTEADMQPIFLRLGLMLPEDQQPQAEVEKDVLLVILGQSHLTRLRTEAVLAERAKAVQAERAKALQHRTKMLAAAAAAKAKNKKK